MSNTLVTELIADDSRYQKAISNAIESNNRYRQSTASAVESVQRDFNQLSQPVESAQKGFDQLALSGESLKSVMVGVGSAVAGALAIGSIQSFTSATMDAMDQTGKFAGRIGISTDALQELRYAAGQSGVEMREFDTSMQRMTRRVSEAANGTGVAVAALDELGLSAVALNQLSPDQQLRAVAQAMQGVASESDRLRLAVQLFDTGGAGMVNMLAEGSAGIQQMQDDAHRLGRVLDADLIANVEAANDAIDDMQIASGAAAQVMVGKMAPAIQEAATAAATLASSEQAATAASMATYAVIGRGIVALGNKANATKKAVQATQAATNANVAKLAVEAKAQQSAEAFAQAEAARAQAEVRRAQTELDLAQRKASASLNLKNAKQQRTAAANALTEAEKRLATATNRVTVVSGQSAAAQTALSTARRQATLAAQAQTVATKALNGAMALTGGPAGVVVMASMALYSYVSSANESAEANRALADSVDDLLPKLDELSDKKLRVARLDAQDAVRQLEADLKKIEREIENTDTTVTISAYATGGEEMEVAYQAGIDQVTRLEAKQEDLNEKLEKTRNYLTEIDSALNPDVSANNDDYVSGGVSEKELAKQSERNQRWLTQLRQRTMDEQALLDDNYRIARERAETEIADKDLQTEALKLIDEQYDADKQRFHDQEQERKNQQIEKEKALLLSVQQRVMSESDLLWSKYLEDADRIDREIQNEVRKEQALSALWQKYAADKKELDNQLAENERHSIERMLDRITASQERTDTIVQGFASGMSAALADATMSGELSFSRMAESIINDMLRMYYQAQIIGPMMQSFGFGGASAGAGGGGAGTVVAGVNHTGGIAGVADAGSRAVNASVFAGAPRFHTGGIVGSEVPIIAQRGEGVFTAEQMKRLAPVGGPTEMNVSLKIINENGEAKEVDRVEQSQKDGTLELKAFIRSVVSEDVNRGQGFDQTLRAQYPGLQRRGYG